MYECVCGNNNAREMDPKSSGNIITDVTPVQISFTVVCPLLAKIITQKKEKKSIIFPSKVLVLDLYTLFFYSRINEGCIKVHSIIKVLLI